MTMDTGSIISRPQFTCLSAEDVAEHSWTAILGKAVCKHMGAEYQPPFRPTYNTGTNSESKRKY
jgi:hypothetical protein